MQEKENGFLINKKTVRKNKAMKLAQKEAKKRYGKMKGLPKGVIPKAALHKILQPAGEECLDLTGTADKDLQQTTDTKMLSREELLARVEVSGLVGMSGSMFPTIEKLRTIAAYKGKTKYLIVNAVECDPGLVHDEWLLTHKKAEIDVCMEFLQKCLDIQMGFLATRTELGNQVPNRYPMGYEKILIHFFTGEELAKNDIPAEHGYLVLNVQTVLALGALITGEAGKQMDSRYLTVADFATARAVVVKAKMGTKVKDIFAAAFPDVKPDSTDCILYTGMGSMRAHPCAEDETVDLSTCLIACTKAPSFTSANRCKGCGGCNHFCPAGVQVSKIARALEKGITEGLEQYGYDKCIGCGMCTYICHANKCNTEDISKLNEK